jgi:ABC-2 family transporter protein
MKSGLFYLINLIDTEILRISSKNPNAYINARFLPAPTSAYKTSQVYRYLKGNASSLIAFPLVLIFLRFAYAVLFEKEHKIAQNLRNMGMDMNNYIITWYLFYTIILTIHSIVWTFLVRRKIAPDANFFLFMLLFFVPGMFFLSFALFISSFFTKAKSGVLCCIICYCILVGVDITKNAISGGDLASNTWFALSPLSGLEDASDIILLV